MGGDLILRKVSKYSFLYLKFVKSQLKVMMEYRVDFLVGSFSVLFIQFTSIIFISVVFDNIPSLNGWDYYEILFIYAITTIGRSIHHIFFDNLWTLGSMYIKTGNFDRLLTRPLNPLFHLIAERVQPNGFGNLLIGVYLLCVSILKLEIKVNFSFLFFLIIMILSSSLVFISINLICSTFSFWITDSLPLIRAVFNLSDFTRYPLTIYNKSLNFLLTWIIPYGFTSFYPASFFLEKRSLNTLSYLSPLVALILSVLSYLFWTYGIKRYASTGT